MNMELIFHIEHVKRHIKKLLLQMCCLYACLSRHSHLLALDINNLQTEDKNPRGNICLKLKYLSHLSCYLQRRRTRPILNTCPMSILNICFPFCIHSEVKSSKISKSSFPPKFQVFAFPEILRRSVNYAVLTPGVLGSLLHYINQQSSTFLSLGF